MGFSHGGVAIIYRESLCTMKEIVLPNPGDFEVLLSSTRFPGHSRQLVIVACYIPPTYTAVRAGACLEYIKDAVIHVKRTYRSPFIVVSGDFNQWPLEKALEDFIDLREEDVGCTRGSRTIDRTFTNFGTAVREAFSTAPIQADSPGHGQASDHNTTVVAVSLPRVDAFRWIKYSYRYYNEESVEEFQRWVVGQGWEAVLNADGSQQKALEYQRVVDEAIQKFFPLITVRRKTTDLPWVNAKARRLIKRRKAIFRQEGRSAAWKHLKRRSEVLLRERKKKYEESQKICLLACLLYTSPSPRD